MGSESSALNGPRIRLAHTDQKNIRWNLVVLVRLHPRRWFKTNFLVTPTPLVEPKYYFQGPRSEVRELPVHFLQIPAFVLCYDSTSNAGLDFSPCRLAADFFEHLDSLTIGSVPLKSD